MGLWRLNKHLANHKLLSYTDPMSELQEFVKKRTASFPGISSRKLYGLDAFYQNNLPFIVISSEQIVLKASDFEVKKTLLNMPEVIKWTLNGKEMKDWFLLPESFNKKKNKLDPILEMASKALLNPKKEKKRKKKNGTKKPLEPSKSEIKVNLEKKTSLFKRFFG